MRIVFRPKWWQFKAVRAFQFSDIGCITCTSKHFNPTLKERFSQAGISLGIEVAIVLGGLPVFIFFLLTMPQIPWYVHLGIFGAIFCVVDGALELHFKKHWHIRKAWAVHVGPNIPYTIVHQLPIPGQQ